MKQCGGALHQGMGLLKPPGISAAMCPCGVVGAVCETTRPLGPFQATAVCPQRKQHSIGGGSTSRLTDGTRHCKKSDGLLCQGGARRDAFLLQHQETGPLAVLWAVLAVSRRGVYASAQRHAPLRIAHDERVLLARVKALHAETWQRYGRRQMAMHRHAAGSAVGRVKARRVRRDAGGVGRRRTRRGPVTTDSRMAWRWRRTLAR